MSIVHNYSKETGKEETNASEAQSNMLCEKKSTVQVGRRLLII